MKTFKPLPVLAIFTLLITGLAGSACGAGVNINTNAPVISSLVAEYTTLYPLGNTSVTCAAVIPDGATLNYHWACDNGTITGSGSTIIYEAPRTYGDFHIMASVDDGHGNTSNQTVTVTVIVRDPSKCCR